MSRLSCLMMQWSRSALRRSGESRGRGRASADLDAEIGVVLLNCSMPMARVRLGASSAAAFAVGRAGHRTRSSDLRLGFGYLSRFSTSMAGGSAERPFHLLGCCGRMEQSTTGCAATMGASRVAGRDAAADEDVGIVRADHLARSSPPAARSDVLGHHHGTAIMPPWALRLRPRLDAVAPRSTSQHSRSPGEC
jgi:hypothetical protein